MSRPKPTCGELEQRLAESESELARIRQDAAVCPESPGQSGAVSPRLVELEASEARFRALVEVTSDWIWEVDAQGIYRYASPTVRDFLGYEPSEIIGKRPFDFMPPEESSRVSSVIGPIMAAAQPFSGLENINRRKDGSLIHLETNGIPILNADGELLGYRGIDRDITRRKQAEEQLRQALERLRLHVENSPMAVVEWGPDFRLSYWNKEAERIFGWQASEVLGRRMDEFRWVYEEDADQVERIAQGLLHGTESRSINVNRNYRKDGSIVHCQWYNSSLLDASGRLVSILSLVLDITGRTRAEEALKESEQRLRLAVTTASLAIWEWNLEDSSVRWDKSCEYVFGSPAESDISYQWWVDRIHPQDRERVLEELDRGVAGDVEFMTLEYRFLREDGSWVYLYDRAHFQRDASGRAVRLLGAAMDVTDLRKAEEGLKDARDQLEQRVLERTCELSRTVDALHDEVTQRLDAEKALRRRSEQLRLLAADLTLAEQRERQRLGQVLHDGLQQLLVGAKFRLSLLDLENDDPANLVAVKEAITLIDESIQVSRSLTAELSPPVLRTGLIPALRWLVRRMHHMHGLDTELMADDDANPASDELKTLLFHAVRELLFNVVKHSATKTARVQLTRSGGEFQLIVSDDGVGFDPAQLRHDGGALGGTGLFSVRERLDQMGGRMVIDSAPERGTRCIVHVPSGSQV